MQQLHAACICTHVASYPPGAVGVHTVSIVLLLYGFKSSRLCSLPWQQGGSSRQPREGSSTYAYHTCLSSTWGTMRTAVSVVELLLILYRYTCGTRRKLAAFFCVWIWNETNTIRGHWYCFVWVRMRHEHSKSYNKQFVQTAVHLNSCITLCLWLLYCCVPIQSHPRGLPHVLFFLLYVAVFAYTAHTLYIAVLCTCHNNMYSDPLDRNYTQLWDIMYHIIPVPLNCIHTHNMYVSSSPGEARHSFFETCPPCASFVGLPFPVLSRTRFLWTCLYDIILHRIPNIT